MNCYSRYQRKGLGLFYPWSVATLCHPSYTAAYITLSLSLSLFHTLSFFFIYIAAISA